MSCKIKVSAYPDTVVIFDDRIRKDINELYVDQRKRSVAAAFALICFSLIIFLSLWLLTDPTDRSLEVFKMFFIADFMLFFVTMFSFIKLYLAKRMLKAVYEQDYRIEQDVIDDMSANGRWLRDGSSGTFAELKLRKYYTATQHTINLNRDQYVELYILDPAFLLYIGKAKSPVIAYLGAGFRT